MLRLRRLCVHACQTEQVQKKQEQFSAAGEAIRDRADKLLLYHEQRCPS